MPSKAAALSIDVRQFKLTPLPEERLQQ